MPNLKCAGGSIGIAVGFARKRELLQSILTQFPNSVLAYDWSPLSGGFETQWAEPFKDHWVVPPGVKLDDRYLSSGAWALFYAHPDLTSTLMGTGVLFDLQMDLEKLLATYGIAYLLTAEQDDDPWTIAINPRWHG